MTNSNQRATGGMPWKVVIAAGIAMFVFAIIQLVNGNWVFAIIQGIIAAVFLWQGDRARRASRGN
jgi:predicted LPLAT superfamily acyltransferase